MTTPASTVQGTLSTGPFLVSVYAERTPQPGDRRTLTRAWFVTPRDEYGLTRHCSPVAQHIDIYDGDASREPGEPDWYCERAPILQIEQVTEEWQGRAAAGVWLPTSRASGNITLCERHARSFLGDAKYDALPWPGGQVAFAPASEKKGTHHDRTR